MKIGIFIPCYINELYPDVARDTILLLRKLKLNIEIPRNQTCCGQPFLNSGYDSTLPQNFDKIFKKYDYIVAPSSSCVSTIREANIPSSKKTFELVEFIHDILKLKDLIKNHPPIILHNSCHSLRSLFEGAPSELNIPYFNKIKNVLGCKILEAKRDECCGFGGVFSMKEGFLSFVMGKSKLEDLLNEDNLKEITSTPIITGVDMSCLMHLQSIAKKENIKAKFKHISTVLLEGLQ